MRLLKMRRADYIFCGKCNTELTINRTSEVVRYLVIISIVIIPLYLFENEEVKIFSGIGMLLLFLLTPGFTKLDKKQ